MDLYRINESNFYDFKIISNLTTNDYHALDISFDFNSKYILVLNNKKIRIFLYSFSIYKMD